MNRQIVLKIAILSWIVAAITFLVFLTVGCAHAPKGTPSVYPVTGHIDKAYDDLSASDSKAVLIESWIK